MKTDLSPKQIKIYHYIEREIEITGYPPTLKEIALHFNMSISGANAHLFAMQKKGHIKRVPNISRGLQLIKNSTTKGGK